MKLSKTQEQLIQDLYDLNLLDMEAYGNEANDNPEDCYASAQKRTRIYLPIIFDYTFNERLLDCLQDYVEWESINDLIQQIISNVNDEMQNDGIDIRDCATMEYLNLMHQFVIYLQHFEE